MIVFTHTYHLNTDEFVSIFLRQERSDPATSLGTISDMGDLAGSAGEFPSSVLRCHPRQRGLPEWERSFCPWSSLQGGKETGCGAGQPPEL